MRQPVIMVHQNDHIPGTNTIYHAYFIYY